MNSSGADQFARHLPFGLEWRDKGDDRDQAGFDKELRYFRHAADILDPIGFGKAEVAIEAVPDVIAVEHERVLA